MPRKNSLSIKLATSAKISKLQTLRLRVFAGPNGSGKSTIINSVKEFQVNGRPIDFGYYINADDIARSLKKESYDFSHFGLTITKKKFEDFAVASGLIGRNFTHKIFISSFKIYKNRIRLTELKWIDQIAQLIARFLREELLASNKRFTFETVFSHPSNLDIMKRAANAGYKVYLYFVSTESAEINKYRVKLRVAKGGHDVPEDRIESRYTRSLDLLFDAAQIAYKAFFFDNSIDEEPYKHFADFTQVDGKKETYANYILTSSSRPFSSKNPKNRSYTNRPLKKLEAPPTVDLDDTYAQCKLCHHASGHLKRVMLPSYFSH